MSSDDGEIICGLCEKERSDLRFTVHDVAHGPIGEFHLCADCARPGMRSLGFQIAIVEKNEIH